MEHSISSNEQIIQLLNQISKEERAKLLEELEARAGEATKQQERKNIISAFKGIFNEHILNEFYSTKNIEVLKEKGTDEFIKQAVKIKNLLSTAFLDRLATTITMSLGEQPRLSKDEKEGLKRRWNMLQQEDSEKEVSEIINIHYRARKVAEKYDVDLLSCEEIDAMTDHELREFLEYDKEAFYVFCNESNPNLPFFEKDFDLQFVLNPETRKQMKDYLKHKKSMNKTATDLYQLGNEILKLTEDEAKKLGKMLEGNSAIKHRLEKLNVTKEVVTEPLLPEELIKPEKVEEEAKVSKPKTRKSRAKKTTTSKEQEK